MEKVILMISELHRQTHRDISESVLSLSLPLLLGFFCALCVKSLFLLYNSVAKGNSAMFRARLIASPSQRW